MTWKSSPAGWGWSLISLHWFTAVTVFGLYALGWYMVDLDYYDPWYRTAPFWHKSVGLLLVLVVLFRLSLRLAMRGPEPLPSHAPWEHLAAKLAHWALYILLFVCFVSGYLISTADGRGISFFDLFDVPSLISDIDNLEDLAGEVHVLATDSLLLLAGFHAAAGLKHHFIDRDATLKRMLGFDSSDTNNQ